MRIAILAGAMAAAMALVGPCFAADDGGCDVGVKKAKAMKLLSGDMVRDMTLQMVLPTMLADEALTTDRILASTRDCARGAFELGGKTFNVFGSKSGAPGRWAASADGETISYLMKFDYDMRSLNPSYHGSGWMLVVQQGDTAEVVRAYKAIPDDAAMLTEFQAALAGRFPPVVGYDRKTKSINIYMPR